MSPSVLITGAGTGFGRGSAAGPMTGTYSMTKQRHHSSSEGEKWRLASPFVLKG